MTGVGPTEFAVFLRLPVMLTLVSTSLAILLRSTARPSRCCARSCWSHWRRVFVLIVVSVFTLVVR